MMQQTVEQPSSLRVGLLSYPMLYQRTGGLQIQVAATLDALRAIGVDAAMVDPVKERLDQYHLIHVFSLINGNHRIVETAKGMGCKVVLSPLVQPSWTRAQGRRAAMLDRIVGKLTGWEVQTSYGQMRGALALADSLVALGHAEQEAMAEAFGVQRSRISIIENGIAREFFEATPDEFRQRTGIHGPFVLCVAGINDYKNQQAIVQALQGTDTPVVLIGDCLSEDKPYLAALQQHANVHYLGRVAHGDPLLRSAYAAATVFALPSRGEVMPLSVMEALAAGTPVVMTDRHAMHLASAQEVVREHAPEDIAQLRRHLLDSLSTPAPADQCRRAVADFSWDSVARRLLQLYRKTMG